MGDYFAIRGAVVMKLVRKNAEAALRNNDQLRNQRGKGLVFEGFSEGKVSFKPTYKYDPGTDDYDSSKKARIPAWTDRILYRTVDEEVRKRLQLCNYDAQNLFKISDHRPVFALFNVRIVKGKEADDGAGAEAGTSSSLCAIQ